MSPAPQPEPSAHRLALLAGRPVSVLSGVGPKAVTALEEMGLCSLLDLVMHYPRRYADRSNSRAIAELAEGEEATVQGVVSQAETIRTRRGRPIVRITLADDADSHLTLTFFNQAWRARQLRVGAEIVVFGRVEDYRGTPRMTNPRVDLVGAPEAVRQTGRIVPIYPQSDKAGVASYQLAAWIVAALEVARALDAFADPLSPERALELGLIGRAEAFRAIHQPVDLGEVQAARRRLAFDELWRLQVLLVMRKRAMAEQTLGIAHTTSVLEPRRNLTARFLDGLPFPLTAAQARVITEITEDLGRPHPMHRLLQGDVGAGKTVVALAALLIGIQGGYQSAIMVPTEVLAEQHFFAACHLLEGLTVPDSDRLLSERPLAVALLTSKTPAGERARLLAGLAVGEIDLLVGTHSLITEEVRFSALGVVVIDEQHRFGVDQRAALHEKGSDGPGPVSSPDLLVMTATPIPRTAAMTVYGDLDYSVLDELPPGRSPVATEWVDEEAEAGVWERVRVEVGLGRQAFVVCPRVSADGPDEETGDLTEEADVTEEREESLFPLDSPPRPESRPGGRTRGAVDEYERLRESELSGHGVGLLHGRLPVKEKDAVMEAFRRGELDVLVATTVVEVGVDVPRATVMVIEDADRFGIAQLHQLRGRVGRSDIESVCFLLASEVTPAAERRLAALCTTNDGFELAEVDLELRGEGTVLGIRQKGRSNLRLASLRRDRDLIGQARRLAESILDRDPRLDDHPLFREELRLFVAEEDEAYLFRS